MRVKDFIYLTAGFPPVFMRSGFGNMLKHRMIPAGVQWLQVHKSLHSGAFLTKAENTFKIFKP